MLKRLLNECRLEVELNIKGRLLVKEPQEETERRAKERGSDQKVVQPVATQLPNGDPTIYLPGSSIKGALRAQAERIARTLNHQAGACDPFAIFSKNGNSPSPSDVACSERIAARQRHHQHLQRQTPPTSELTIPQQYSEVCPICRTFGHLGWGKRLRISDFYPSQVSPSTMEITHIGIDRVGGGVSTEYKGHNNNGAGRTFTLQYVYQGHLRGTIIIENFELWQLGLIGLLWRDWVDGLIPIGHKQSAGAGVMKPQLLGMTLTQFGRQAPQNEELCGIGALYDAPQLYGYDPQTDRVAHPDLQWSVIGISWHALLDQAQAHTLWRSLAGRTATHLAKHQWAPAMSVERIATLVRKTDDE